MKKLYGITVAMVTPMDENGAVDLGGVAKLTEMLIAKGVHCLYPCGTTGEMLKLSTQERKQIAETVVKTAAGRVTVFIHTGAENPEKTLELSLHAHAIGADGVGIMFLQKIPHGKYGFYIRLRLDMVPAEQINSAFFCSFRYKRGGSAPVGRVSAGEKHHVFSRVKKRCQQSFAFFRTECDGLIRKHIIQIFHFQKILSDNE